MEQWEKAALQLATMQKMNIRLILKIKCVTELSLIVDDLNVVVYTSQ